MRRVRRKGVFGVVVIAAIHIAAEDAPDINHEGKEMSSRTYEVISTAGIPPDEIAMLLSLQGLANRTDAEVYLLSKPDGQEKVWIEWYKRYGLEPKEVSVDEALAAHARDAKGYIVYDPEMGDSLNVAVDLAGVKDAWVCAPSQVERLEKLGLKRIDDLRGRWTDRIAAYQWAVEHVMPQCDLRTLANYEQGSRAQPKPDMDYIIAHRGFCMGLSINQADYPQEAAIWDKVQNAAPPHAIMLGWHTSRDSEATHVYFGSQHNIHVYCSLAPNMSFHQYVKARKPYHQDHCKSAACDPKAKYVTISLSDGDSWHSMVDGQKKFWRSPHRGEVPIGWQVSPSFVEAGPAILEYYFENRTPNDYLLSGPSGISYNYLSGFKDWQGYLRVSDKAMRTASLRTIWVINRVVRHLPGGVIEHRLKDGPIKYTRKQMEEFGGIKDQNGADWVDPQMVERYIHGMPDALGFFQGWESIPGEGPRWVDGKLWSPTQVLIRRDVDAVMKEFDHAAAAQPVPTFIPADVNCYDADMDVVVDVVHRLEAKGYKVVRPDVFLRLAQDANKRGLRQ